MVRLCLPTNPWNPAMSFRDLPVSRREVLNWAAAGLTVAALPAGALLADEAGPLPTGPRSPEEALRLLYVGNERFVARRATLSARPGSRRGDAAAPLAPFTAMLACADLHLPPELIFDQGFGDLYVTRVAANVAALDEIGSLEFGITELGARVLYVLGHMGCGTMTAAMKGTPPAAGPMGALFDLLRPAVQSAGGDLETAIRDNVRGQMESLRQSSRAVADRVRAGTLVLAGGVFDPTTGRVEPVVLG
jgi:carbonic anhydrase